MSKTIRRKPATKTAGPAAATQPRPASAANDRLEPNRWTFLTNHAHVLLLLARDPSVVLREVATRVGITERAVQRIIAELEEEGYIERERVGRQNHYRIHRDKKLRHPIEDHQSIGSLLSLIDR